MGEVLLSADKVTHIIADEKVGFQFNNADNHVIFYAFLNLCASQKQLITVYTRLFPVVCRDPCYHYSPRWNYDGQNSHALAPTALVSITFLVYVVPRNN